MSDSGNGNALAPREPLDPVILERLVIGGDLSALSPAQRIAYYAHRCHAIGLDPAARPFQYLSLSGKLTLYADKGCAQQLGARDRLTFTIASAKVEGDLFVVVGRVSDPAGRTTDDLGAVAIGGLRGEALANAAMKARTKAHRRAVLSHCGLGELDESEVASIPDAQRVAVEAAHADVSMTPPPTPAPGSSARGLLKDLNIYVSPQDIEEVRRESMAGSPDPRTLAFTRMTALGWTPTQMSEFARGTIHKASSRDYTLDDWQALHRALDAEERRAREAPPEAMPPDGTAGT